MAFLFVLVDTFCLPLQKSDYSKKLLKRFEKTSQSWKFSKRSDVAAWSWITTSGPQLAIHIINISMEAEKRKNATAMQDLATKKASETVANMVGAF
ncbi:hypothetical protein [Emticicia sp. C21]|uniref:hypothetical protein n=1 Tax=Emticicia sp. C21 TaxID=2302915 RepID=UPI000E3519F7|nr:hypothetical protein [Emticicia sp. C21]RFS18059.1 hypothetical protein D0T08_02085 [Emticicia sp. C21]